MSKQNDEMIIQSFVTRQFTNIKTHVTNKVDV